MSFPWNLDLLKDLIKTLATFLSSIAPKISRSSFPILGNKIVNIQTLDNPNSTFSPALRKYMPVG
jgi:hypothetical protein